MGLPPIKLQLGGEELHLVPARDLDRWGGYSNGRRAAWELTRPENVGALRTALLIEPHRSTEAVFVELRKQLEDGTALFFEVPPSPVAWEQAPSTDLIDLLPDGRRADDSDRGGAGTGVSWIEILCVSPEGSGFAGSKARVRLPDGRTEHVTLDGRSVVRFDDVTEHGTAHFELSADSVPKGDLGVTSGIRYELGSPTGLVLSRRHVLVVHPNPRAFVSVEVLVDGAAVPQGRYRLSSSSGVRDGELSGDAVREAGLMLPSNSSLALDLVLIPPRGSSADDERTEHDEGPGETLPVLPTGGEDSTHEPGAPETDRESTSPQHEQTDEVECVRLEGLCFPLNKTFILPEALEGIRILGSLYASLVRPALLLVGHTDASGTTAGNLSLSLERARSVAAYLRDDVDAWLAHYEPSSPLSSRWGEPEDLSMLSALPYGNSPYKSEGVRFVDAVRLFQSAHGLVQDGVAGERTRRVLVAEYMAADGTTVPRDCVVTCHGCGSAFPLDAAEADDEQNRRVDVFFFGGGSVVPSPAGPTTGPEEGLYPAWQAAVDRERSFRPTAEGMGSLDLVVDAQSIAGLDSIAYRLFSTDSVYDERKTLADAQFHEDHGVLVFDAMPKGSAYSLEVTELDGRTTTVFADVAFERLDELSDALDDEASAPFDPPRSQGDPNG